MYQMDASVFVEWARVCGYASGVAAGNPSADDKSMPHTGPDHALLSNEAMVLYFADMEKRCTMVGLKASATTCRAIQGIFKRPDWKLKELRQQYNDLAGRLRDELESTLCYGIDPSHITYFTTKHRYGTGVANRFAPAADDIEEAGKCLAFGRATACVFHLMRVLEVGLQALADKLQISMEQNWQKLLNSVNGAIKRLPHGTAEEKELLSKHSAAALFLQQVKDAWRNDVMHPRASYTEEQAQEIDGVTKSLMAKLAEFV